MQIRSLMVPAGMLGVVLVALVTTVVFVFTTFIILTVRNVLIVLTIIVSPLAFAAMILPGTNNLFEKWRKLFMGLLILFPALMALLYGGVLVGQIILRTYDPKADIFTRLFIIILVLFVSNIGVVGARALFELIVKFLGSAGRYFGRFNDPNKGPIDRARKKSDEMYKNSKWAGAMNYRKAMREYKGVKKRGSNFLGYNTITGGRGYAASARRKAAAIDQKEDLEAVGDATAQQAHMTNRNNADIERSLMHIATGATKTYRDKAGRQRKVTEYDRVAAARKVLESGNYAERQQIYDSVAQEGTEEFKKETLLRKEVSDGMYKRGDTATLHPGYGGQVLTGTNGGARGRLKSVAKSIGEGRIKASALVHDAQATKDVLTVMEHLATLRTTAAGQAEAKTRYGFDFADIDQLQRMEALSKVAHETLNGEETKGTAVTPAFLISLNKLEAMYP